MEIIEDNKNLPKEAFFNLSIKNNKELIGNLTVYKHPQDSVGGRFIWKYPLNGNLIGLVKV